VILPDVVICHTKSPLVLYNPVIFFCLITENCIFHKHIFNGDLVSYGGWEKESRSNRGEGVFSSNCKELLSQRKHRYFLIFSVSSEFFLCVLCGKFFCPHICRMILFSHRDSGFAGFNHKGHKDSAQRSQKNSICHFSFDKNTADLSILILCVQICTTVGF